MYKLPAVAEYLGISLDTARRYVKSGEIPSTFIGGAYRVEEEDLKEFVESKRSKSPKATAPSAPGLPEERTPERALFEAAKELEGRVGGRAPSVETEQDLLVWSAELLASARSIVDVAEALGAADTAGSYAWRDVLRRVLIHATLKREQFEEKHELEESFRRIVAENFGSAERAIEEHA